MVKTLTQEEWAVQAEAEHQTMHPYLVLEAAHNLVKVLLEEMLAITKE